MDTSKRILKLIMQILLVLAVLLIVDTMNNYFRGDYSKKSDISFTETQISFSDASGEEIVISYSDVVSIELVIAPDYGEPVNGQIKNGIRLGTWESADLGIYLSRTQTDIADCILIRTASQTCAVNYENNDTTALLLGELQKYI